VDARAPSDEALGELVAAVERAAGEVAGRTGCDIDLERTWLIRPVRMAERVRVALADAAAAAGVEAVELPSGAGHDAGILAGAGVETGMLFVRSRNGGVSHRPDELTAEDDVAAAIGVLAGALATLAAAW
jgi:acetylornithine deacetylase/succinyl-diaminopimelate desuccinylase-like protein